MEGRFARGQQIDFGRMIITDPQAEEKNYITEQMAYTGWWPTSYSMGQGIGIIDDETVYQGEWQPIDNFPNSGRDIHEPYHLYSYTVRDFTNREMYRGLFGGLGTYEEIKPDNDYG